MCTIDLFIKVWGLQAIESTTTGFGGTSGFNTASTSTQSLELTLVSTITLSGFESPPKQISIAPLDTIIAIPFKGNLSLVNYSSNFVVSPKKSEQDQLGNIVHIASGHILGLWITAHDDGTVKLWDGDNVVIREIQFNATIYSLSFANPRGDLLIGLATQVSLVKLQDYLPNHILKQMARIEEIDDDYIEGPITFDEEMDFWEYYYNERKDEINEEEEEWHIKKRKPEILDFTEDDDNLEQMLNESKSRRKRLDQEQARQKFLKEEEDRFKIYLKMKEENHNSDPVPLADIAPELLTSEPLQLDLIEPTTPKRYSVNIDQHEII